MRRRAVTGALYATPAAVLVGLFFVVPLLLVGWMSLHRWPLLGRPRLNAPDNYTAIADNALLTDAAWFTLRYTVSHPRPVSTTSRRYSPRCFFPSRNVWLSSVTVPAPLTRRRNVTRPSASGSFPVGTTKLVGSFRSLRPRRCCAGVWPPSRGWACCVLTASCSRVNSRRRSGRAGRPYVRT